MNFSQNVNEKFKNLNVKVQFIPNIYQLKKLKRKINELNFSDFDSYYDFLTKEKEFWMQYKDNDFFKDYVKAYDNALNNIKSPSQDDIIFKSQVNTSLHLIEKIPNSTSILVKELIKHKDKPRKFFEGFFDSITEEEKGCQNQTKNYTLGLYVGFQYIGLIKKIDDMLPNQQESFENTQVKFINIANEYVNKYNELYVQKEMQFNAMEQKIEEELQQNKKANEEFLQEKLNKFKDLEKLYDENLRLKKPAEYWSKMSSDYEQKGKKYIGWSIIMGLIALLLLSSILIFVPEITNFDNWFDLLKNTAIFTIITTIWIYILRIFIKIAMSSFHLARDAKEREQLTYFYLSLINEKAVTDSERELIITSLFSRSDTGLLKGDASPEMPTINFGDMLNNRKS